MRVELTYFKPSGKYYTEGSFDVTDDTDLSDIWDEVRQMRKDSELPDLSLGSAQDFHVLVNVPQHPHDHPKLLVWEPFELMP